jgi:hypothetical protein
MEPLLIVLVPGVLGGIILAALLARKRITLRAGGVDRRLAPPSPSLINMAHIPVEGGGGLGIVAAVIAVALAEPRIRVAIGIAALLGGGLAWLLIVLRRDRGPLVSGGDDSGPHSMLGLGRDGRPGRAPRRSDGDRNHLPMSKAGTAGLRLATGR